MRWKSPNKSNNTLPHSFSFICTKALLQQSSTKKKKQQRQKGKKGEAKKKKKKELYNNCLPSKVFNQKEFVPPQEQKCHHRSKKKKEKKMACQLPNFKFFSIFIHNKTCITVPSNYRNCNNKAKDTNTISAKIHILSILKITVPIIFQKTFKINPRNNMDVSSAFIKFHSSRSNAIQSKLSKHLKKKQNDTIFTRVFLNALCHKRFLQVIFYKRFS